MQERLLRGVPSLICHKVHSTPRGVRKLPQLYVLQLLQKLVLQKEAIHDLLTQLYELSLHFSNSISASMLL